MSWKNSHFKVQYLNGRTFLQLSLFNVMHMNRPSLVKWLEEYEGYFIIFKAKNAEFTHHMVADYRESDKGEPGTHTESSSR
jgi:hypothetical protein